jgi:hypothetical protein
VRDVCRKGAFSYATLMRSKNKPPRKPVVSRRALGEPELRELVLARHVVLYAHSEQEVVLLSIRHERQLGCGLPKPST